MAIPLTTNPELVGFTVGIPDDTLHSPVEIMWRAHAGAVVVQWTTYDSKTEEEVVLTNDSTMDTKHATALLALGYELPS